MVQMERKLYSRHKRLIRALHGIRAAGCGQEQAVAFLEVHLLPAAVQISGAFGDEQ